MAHFHQSQLKVFMCQIMVLAKSALNNSIPIRTILDLLLWLFMAMGDGISTIVDLSCKLLGFF